MAALETILSMYPTLCLTSHVLAVTPASSQVSSQPVTLQKHSLPPLNIESAWTVWAGCLFKLLPLYSSLRGIDCSSAELCVWTQEATFLVSLVILTFVCSGTSLLDWICLPWPALDWKWPDFAFSPLNLRLCFVPGLPTIHSCLHLDPQSYSLHPLSHIHCFISPCCSKRQGFDLIAQEPSVLLSSLFVLYEFASWFLLAW